jgi:hypothetical protein
MAGNGRGYEQLGIITPKLFGLAKTFDLFIYFRLST